MADAKADELRAARVSLGALGAIVAVTLRCVPAFTIHRVDEPRPLDDVLPRLDELVDANDHWEAFVMPYTRRALTLTSERTDRAPTRLGAWPSSCATSCSRTRCLAFSAAQGGRFRA